ncbi:MAG: helix-turn-helix transcriptional regulator [Chloroflexota bacterium]|nr:helix-turn-helix transcriptional regulator [Chloroflexota bacterium]
MSIPIPDETILGVLASEPQHGYQLLDTFRDPARLGAIWNLSASQLYAVLKRIEGKGWIVGREIAGVDAPPRMEYAITPDGRAALMAWLHAAPAASIRRVRVEFLSRLYVAGRLHLTAADIIARQKAACAAELTRLTDVRAALGSSIGAWSLELQLGQLHAVLDWIARCETMFNAQPEI